MISMCCWCSLDYFQICIGVVRRSSATSGLTVHPEASLRYYFLSSLKTMDEKIFESAKYSAAVVFLYAAAVDHEPHLLCSNGEPVNQTRRQHAYSRQSFAEGG